MELANIFRNKTNLTAMREGGFSDSLELYQRQVKTTAMIQAERVQAIAPQDMIECMPTWGRAFPDTSLLKRRWKHTVKRNEAL
jgi:hypothetical protein